MEHLTCCTTAVFQSGFAEIEHRGRRKPKQNTSNHPNHGMRTVFEHDVRLNANNWCNLGKKIGVKPLWFQLLDETHIFGSCRLVVVVSSERR